MVTPSSDFKNTMALEKDEIEALATATATATATALQGLRAETATVNAVTVKLPIFWSGVLRFGLHK